MNNSNVFGRAATRTSPAPALVISISIAAIALVLAMTLTACDGQQADAAPRTVEFAVDGMHCDGCSDAITHRLVELPGVTECIVDHDAGTASIVVVSHDPQIDARIAEAIAGLGFVVRRPGVAPAAEVDAGAEADADE